MKRYLYIISALVFVACTKGDGQSTSGEVSGYGSVAISAQISTSAFVVESRSSDESSYEIAAELIPQQEDLTLHITGEYVDPDSKEVVTYDRTFANIEEYATSGDGELPLLYSGDYRATLSDGGDAENEGEGCAVFGSQSVDFSVEKYIYDAELNMDVTLQNSIFRLSCDEWFKSYFSEATFIITTSLGSEFTFDPFDEQSMEQVIYVAADSELKLKGSAVKSSGAQEVTFAENVLGVTKAGYMNTIAIEATSVGALVVSVTFNQDIVEIHEEKIELNPIE